jgi:hypothetical protein
MPTSDIVESEDSAAADEVAREIITGEPFSPREETGREGVLIVGQPSKPRPEAALRVIALTPLIDLVRQSTYWGEDRQDLEERLGDVRSLILEFRRDDGLLLYVQIWSAPAHETMLDVGTDPPADVLGGAFFESAREPLTSRGFEVASHPGHFRKLLPVPSTKDPARIASEMFGLLTEVLGYDGSMALVYRIRQATVLKTGPVMYGIMRRALHGFLRVWGLEPTAPSDEPTMLTARSHGINFRIHLLAPSRSAPDVYWEVHLTARFAIPRERVMGLFDEVNGNAWLVKAYVLPEQDEETRSVRLAYGLNLAGGVTPDHLKSQIFEWVENVRRLWIEWGQPVAPRLKASDLPGETVH